MLGERDGRERKSKERRDAFQILNHSLDRGLQDALFFAFCYYHSIAQFIPCIFIIADSALYCTDFGMISFPRRWILSFILVCITLSVVFNVSEHASWTPPPPEHAPLLPPDFSWKNLPRQWPVTPPMIQLPTGPPSHIPRIQHKPVKETPVEAFKRQKRLAAVKNSFKHSWDGYKKNAWLQDEVRPLAGGYKNGFGGWGATLIDSLDTLWIMDMKEDFVKAVDALNYLDFTTSSSNSISVFETTIRYVGGLLSAYDLSDEKYPILLNKATELGDMLYASFDTPNGMPVVGSWNWIK
jgi:mannosyl-oligosaccharide alpha-1,2-mannosidase